MQTIKAIQERFKRGNTKRKLTGLLLKGEFVPDMELIKTPGQIAGIKKSAALNTAVLDYAAKHVRAGVSTAYIDRLVYDYTVKHGGMPASLGYEDFKYSTCTSLNNEMCHGIPSESVILKEGDILNVDVSTVLNGYYSDASRMFAIGRVSDRAARLIRVTEECVKLGVAAARPWGHLGDIAHAIQTHAEKNGYFVAEDFGGHGIGLAFHEDPYVCYVGERGTDMVLAPGLIFTIEPMINEGSPGCYVDESNGWTVCTVGHGLSAQIEYMVLITATGAEILSN